MSKIRFLGLIGMLLGCCVAAADGLPTPSHTTKKYTDNDATNNYIYSRLGAAHTNYKRFKETTGGYISKSPKLNLMYHIGLGHRFTKSFRGDLSAQYGELIYRAREEDDQYKQKVKLYGLIFNGYYDVNINKIIVPYLTAGIGVGNNSTSDLVASIPGNPEAQRWDGKKKINLIWNVGTGLRFNLHKHINLDLGYRYVDLGYANTKDSTDSDGDVVTAGKQKIHGHQILGSIIFNF